MSSLKLFHPWPVRICSTSKLSCYRRFIYPVGAERSMGNRKLHSNTHGFTPRAVQPSTWQSIIPKALRGSKTQVNPARSANQSKDWNPATFFIFIFLLIGSNAIQMISLRNDFLNFSRKSEAKIGLLKEIIGRVQRGEDVDVEGLLGTGDEEQERQWEEVIREIEDADQYWDPFARRRKDRKASKPKEGQSSMANKGGEAKGIESADYKPEEGSNQFVTIESTPRGFY